MEQEVDDVDEQVLRKLTNSKKMHTSYGSSSSNNSINSSTIAINNASTPRTPIVAPAATNSSNSAIDNNNENDSIAIQVFSQQNDNVNANASNTAEPTTMASNNNNLKSILVLEQEIQSSIDYFFDSLAKDVTNLNTFYLAKVEELRKDYEKLEAEVRSI